MLAPAPTRHDRMSMHNANKLKIGLFGANCSSGRAVTLVPERWSGSWPDNLKLARMADEAGLDFLLPIGRWKGYGGDTDYQGATLETITWATGLLALTKRITVFGTVHAPLFNPVIAAKEMVTADHIGEGRFGLNIVVGWNEGEFADVRRQAARPRVPLRICAGMDRRHQDDLVGQGGFRLRGPVSQHEGHPRQAEALRRHAAGDHECRRLAGRAGVRDPQLRRVLPAGVAHLARRDRAAGRKRKSPGKGAGQGARRLHGRRHHLPADARRRPRTITITAIVEHADWRAVDDILALKNITAQNTPAGEVSADPQPDMRRAWAACPSSAIPTTWRASSSI